MDTYAPGSRVTVRDRAGNEWPGTVEAVRQRADGPRYAVRVSPYTVAEVGEGMIAPATPQTGDRHNEN